MVVNLNRNLLEESHLLESIYQNKLLILNMMKLYIAYRQNT
jgi:hypothetical protein